MTKKNLLFMILVVALLWSDTPKMFSLLPPPEEQILEIPACGLTLNKQEFSAIGLRLTLANPQEICDTFYLALVVYREARGETLAGKAGVAHTVLNRVKRGGWWGSAIDEVITKPYQFSSLTDPKDPQLTKWPKLSNPSWQNCLQCAIECLNGTIGDPTGGATHYFDDSITAPKWVDQDAKYKGKIGRLNFYQRTA